MVYHHRRQQTATPLNQHDDEAQPVSFHYRLIHIISLTSSTKISGVRGGMGPGQIGFCLVEQLIQHGLKLYMAIPHGLVGWCIDVVKVQDIGRKSHQW
mmetsp:Transcript_3648/g.6222  ORF Transcript_3648/g.6222 Transcript_3648/m.6222 type:complete len:98 (-) Transcript_3648:618-911(-)